MELNLKEKNLDFLEKLKTNLKEDILAELYMKYLLKSRIIKYSLSKKCIK